MDEQFTCRNDHGWGLSVKGPSPINTRWIACPVCGAPPKPSGPISAWRRSRDWLRRNPSTALGLLGSVLVLMTATTMLLASQWKERGAGRREQTNHRGTEDTERRNTENRDKPAAK